LAGSAWPEAAAAKLVAVVGCAGCAACAAPVVADWKPALCALAVTAEVAGAAAAAG